jgi:hypothetical protein
MPICVAVSALIIVGGCAPENEARDEGRVCVYSDLPEVAGSNQPPQHLEAGQPLYFSVSYGDCLSACVRQEIASCGVELDQQELILQSHFRYDDPPPDQGCIAVCGRLTAVCRSPAVPAGRYEVRHGEARYALDLPSDVERPCWPDE